MLARVRKPAHISSHCRLYCDAGGYLWNNCMQLGLPGLEQLGIKKRPCLIPLGIGNPNPALRRLDNLQLFWLFVRLLQLLPLPPFASSHSGMLRTAVPQPSLGVFLRSDFLTRQVLKLRTPSSRRRHACTAPLGSWPVDRIASFQPSHVCTSVHEYRFPARRLSLRNCSAKGSHNLVEFPTPLPANFCLQQKLWTSNLVLLFRVLMVPWSMSASWMGVAWFAPHFVGASTSESTLVVWCWSFRCQPREGFTRTSSSAAVKLNGLPLPRCHRSSALLARCASLRIGRSPPPFAVVKPVMPAAPSKSSLQSPPACSFSCLLLHPFARPVVSSVFDLSASLLLRTMEYTSDQLQSLTRFLWSQRSPRCLR